MTPAEELDAAREDAAEWQRRAVEALREGSAACEQYRERIEADGELIERLHAEVAEYMERAKTPRARGIYVQTSAADARRGHVVARSGEATAGRWRACPRCGTCFWLRDGEPVPDHATSDDARLWRPCAVTVGEGSEGR